MQKHNALILIGSNEVYKSVCKSLAPKNWQEVYSYFLLTICEKPKEYFVKDLDYKCKGLIKALTRPNSEVNYIHKRKVNTVYVDTFENLSGNECIINIRAEALFNVFEKETDKYIKRAMELMIQGHSQSSIRRLTKNKLPSYELTRVFKVIKSKVIKEYETLCKSL